MSLLALLRLDRCVALALCWFACAQPARAADQPIQIDADGAIELQREAQRVIASGNVRAVRGDLSVVTDRLTANYRTRPDGSSEVYRLQADGAVVIATPNETVESQSAVYDLDKDLLIADSEKSGRRVRLKTKDGGEVTADQRLEYLKRARKLTARGDARAVDGARTLEGEVIVVTLLETSGRAPTTPTDRTSRFERIDADGDVKVVSGEDRITADHGVYEAATDKATFTGRVNVIRGGSELKGCRAEIDLATSVSKLFPCGPGAPEGRQRVSGIIIPGERKSPQGSP